MFLKPGNHLIRILGTKESLPLSLGQRLNLGCGNVFGRIIQRPKAPNRLVLIIIIDPLAHDLIAGDGQILNDVRA
jgi:hypothetical protein